jgi:hypothetical protein
MGTIDGHFLGEFEAEVQTEEEKEEERKRQYPDTTKASYLQYPCHYCGNEFYLINPIRAPNMNPLSIIYDVTDINMVPIIQALADCDYNDVERAGFDCVAVAEIETSEGLGLNGPPPEP